jgi:hypothetical protein
VNRARGYHAAMRRMRAAVAVVAVAAVAVATLAACGGEGSHDRDAAGPDARPVDADPNPPAFVLRSPGPITLVEDGTGVSFEVMLSARPAAPVTASVTTGASARALETTVTLTPGNWDVPQVIRLLAIADDNVSSEAGIVTVHDIHGALADATLAYDVVDDDVLQVVAETKSNPLDLVEQGPPGTIGVSLDHQPPAELTLDVLHSGLVTTSVEQLVFTTTNWATPQDVSVFPLGDEDVAFSQGWVFFTGTVEGMSVFLDLPVSIQDDDVQAFLTEPAAGETVAVGEGETAVVSVRLAFEPDWIVEVTVSPLDPDVATVEFTTIFFTPWDYQTPQVVQVAGVQDDDAEDGATTLRLSAFEVPGVVDIGVTVSDDDGGDGNGE